MAIDEHRAFSDNADASCSAAKVNSEDFVCIQAQFLVDFPWWEKVVKAQFYDTQVFEIATEQLRKIKETVFTLVDDKASCRSCMKAYNKFNKLIATIAEYTDDD